jgi:hypothetical protein
MAAAIGAALLTGVFDVFEDLQIIRLARSVQNSSAKRFGRPKWLLYFLTLGLEGALLLPRALSASGPITISWLCICLASALCILTALLGIYGALQASFERIASAGKLSAFAVVGLTLAPLLDHIGFPLTSLTEYAVLFRVPLLIGIIVIALPFLAFFSSARSLLKGLFDVTPPSMFAVTLAAAAVGGTVSNNARLIYLHAHQRIPGLSPPSFHLYPRTWLLVTLSVSLPVIIAAVAFSIRQCRGTAGLILAATVGLLGSLYLQALASRLLIVASWSQFVTDWMIDSQLFNGYILRGDSDPRPDHLCAVGGFPLALFIYAVLGVYGRWTLGKRHTARPLLGADGHHARLLGLLRARLLFRCLADSDSADCRHRRYAHGAIE